MSRRILMPALLGLAILMTAGLAVAQDGGGGRRGQGGGGGGGFGGGNFDPAQMRQGQLDRIKERLAAKDDEWAVLQPKLEKVLDAQRDAMAGRGFGGRRGGGGGGGGGMGPGADTPAGRALADLRTVLDNESATAEEISAKLTALREARAKAAEALAAAQKDLKSVLTARQEAILVTTGTLD